MLSEFDTRYRAVESKDARFDGWFFTAVTSTGIYCRPSCPAMTPRREHVRFYPTAAAAQVAGFRACKRCRPDATPGSPAWNVRADVVGRAMRLIADGVVDREGVAGLAGQLAVSERHLNRLLSGELGAGPLALARAQRAQTARILLETTELPAAAVAFAAGFSSVRQFNDTVQHVFASTPTDLRRKADKGRDVSTGAVTLRLAYRAPLDADGLLRFLGDRAVTGVEAVTPDGAYCRSLRLPHGPGIVWLRPAQGYVSCTLRLEDLRDLSVAVQRCRRLLDLDADPRSICEVLTADETLAPLVARAPGRRVPGHVDGWELAVRGVLGQQVSVAGARTLAGRLVARYGTPLARPCGGITHLFPEPAALAESDLADLGLTGSRRATLRALAAAVASGALELSPGADRPRTEQQLLALPGIGPWTAAYVAMRALSDPDAFLPSDLGVRKAAERLGLPTRPADLTARAEAWSPWRAYATQHLWASLAAPIPQASGG